MPNAVRSWLLAHPVAAYFIAAVTISWLIATPLALANQVVLPVGAPFALHYLMSFGPLIAAVILSAVIGRRSNLRVLLSHLTRWRIGWRWWAVAAGPVALFGLAAVVARLVEGAWPNLGRLGDVNFLGDIGVPVALLVWIATFGFGGETGWRGFALAHLQRRHSVFTATSLVAVMWAVWHAPYWFYVPGYVQLGVAGLAGFLVGLLLGAVLLTWLYNSTAGSVPAVAAWQRPL